MNNKTIIEFGSSGIWRIADLGGCSAEVDNTLLDLQNSSYPTRPHSIIAKYFTYKSRGILLSFTLFISVKDITNLNPGHIDKSEIKIEKISRRGSRSTDNTELGHFTLLFCRGRQRNVPRIITHVQSHCSAHQNFRLATLPSWFS